MKHFQFSDGERKSIADTAASDIIGIIAVVLVLYALCVLVASCIRGL